MRVLVFESDKKAYSAVASRLREEGFAVQGAHSFDEALDLTKLYQFDAILAANDVDNFPSHVRKLGIRTPLIVIFPAADPEGRVDSLNDGADDCMTAPVHADELIARVRAVVRRSVGAIENVLRAGRLVINLNSQQAFVDGNLLNFTVSEYRMAQIIVLRKGMTVTREMMLNHLYGGMDEPDVKIVDVFMCKLRRKLVPHGLGGQTLIKTVRGRGYFTEATN